MNNKLTLLSYLLTSTLLIGCGGDDNPFAEGGGASSNPISDKNFEVAFSPVDPKVIDDEGFYSNVEVELTAYVGDKFNSAVGGGTVYFKTQWGVLDENSCQVANGSCSVTWRSNADFGLIPTDGFNAFTAYTIGEESYNDLNGSGNFDDADIDYLRDIDEPFLDNDHNGVYSINNDEIIDIDNNGAHTPGDNLFNGSNCTHSTLCALSTPSIMISEVTYLNLNQSTPAADLNISISSPTDNDSFGTGTAITFTASAVDVEDGTILGQDNPILGNDIVWSSSLDGPFGAQSNTFSSNVLTVGSHLITSTVTDSDGNTAFAEVNIIITDGSPVATISAPIGGTSVTTGTNVTFTATVTDTEDGNITGQNTPLTGNNIVWSSDLDGNFGANSNSITFSSLSNGTHVITVTATDSDGNTGTSNVGFTVTP